MCVCVCVCVCTCVRVCVCGGPYKTFRRGLLRQFFDPHYPKCSVEQFLEESRNMATKINHQISPNSGPTELQLKSILIITFTTGMFLNLLPQENIDGNPVPTVIFKGHPSIFHAFVISVVFAFTGSFCSLMIDKKPKVSRFFAYLSVISMASVFSTVVFPLFLDSFKWGFQGKKQVMVE